MTVLLQHILLSFPPDPHTLLHTLFKHKHIMAPHKRSFDEFAEPLPPFKWGVPYLHNNRPDGTALRPMNPVKPNLIPLYDHALQGVPDQLATVKNFLSHEMDPEKLVSGLTNKISPIFRNICRCRYTRDCFCYSLDARTEFEKNVLPVKVPEIVSPAPKDNFVVRTTMQLATRLVMSEEGLSFFSALISCGRGGQQFHAHPRRHLSAAQKEATIHRLPLFGQRIAIHFREFSRLDDDIGGRCLLGYTRRRTVPGVPMSAHINMNVEKMDGYDFNAPSYGQLSLANLRCSIIRSASVLVHELAHAASYLVVQTKVEPLFNNEPFPEVGHALEGFVFGGSLNFQKPGGGLWLAQWPPADRLTGYNNPVFPKPILSTTRPMPGVQWVDETVYARLLRDQHWDTEGVESGDDRRKPFKKAWLRPYRETTTTAEEHTAFTTGYEEAPLRVNQSKRRRLIGTRGGCWRWEDKRRARRSTSERSRRVQLVRRQEKKQKRKDEFHERELPRLNQAWIDMTF
jgi:hypothetical protein